MTMEMLVGPVLMANDLGRAMALAISQFNPEATIVDYGSYLRVEAPGRCQMDCQKVIEITQQDFILPIDLESVMVSYKGQLEIHNQQVTWSTKKR